MDRAEANNRNRIGSIKTAVSLYREGILGGKPELQNTQIGFSELPSKAKAKELYLANREIGRLDESRKFEESVKSQAEPELFNARKMVKDLTLQIEQSKLNTEVQRREIEILKPERSENGLSFNVEVDKFQYAEMTKDLELVKQELSRLKLDMASVKEAKLLVEKETEDTILRARSCSSSVEALRKEIEDANDEEVLAQLAKIEAISELEAIEAQRQAEATKFLDTMEKTRNRIKDMIQELDQAKKLESILAITSEDVDVLQNELKLLRAMKYRVEQNGTPGGTEVGKGMEKQPENSTLLRSATEELDAAKKELTHIREEGYQFMSSMDSIRDEIKCVSKESAHLKNLEDKADLNVQSLNSKLLNAKAKMEVASVAEKKTKVILSDLSATLHQLETERDASKKERELVREEAAVVREETQKIESKIDLMESELQAAMQELEAVKASEASALDSLKNLTEKTMRDRATTPEQKPSITISKFEYEYLTGHADGAKEMADKKVAAAEAWTGALGASKKEMLKIEIAEKELSQLQAMEEHESYTKQQSERDTQTENLQVQKALRRKSMKDNGNSTPRRAKPHRPSSPGAWYVAKSPSIAHKNKRKAMPNFVRFFSRKGTEKNHLSA
ncbi:PREDICTED: protein PLASTID MOVEMENT IMPAIRED 15-like isoform X2 [Nelumbo nucifera]|nr:PREDICTED: protein PLASTID MOVEMENT IMPAIRED 15-like isoform X2 [Nelumbo nucifera]